MHRTGHDQEKIPALTIVGKERVAKKALPFLFPPRESQRERENKKVEKPKEV